MKNVFVRSKDNSFTALCQWSLPKYRYENLQEPNAFIPINSRHGNVDGADNPTPLQPILTLKAPLKLNGFATAVARIALPNLPSERLHERLGFKKVAHFERIGHKFDRWVDVGYWQCSL